MAANSTKKPITAIAVTKMKSGDVLTDIGDNTGLRVKKTSRATSFIYRYKNFEGKMKQIMLGVYPEIGLADARTKLQEFKALRASGYDPQQYLIDQESRLKAAELEARLASEKLGFTFKAMVDLYLTEKVEDRYSEPDRKGNRKIILGSRKEKGQKEVRRTLYGDVVRVLGDKPVSETPLIEVKVMVDQIIARGANVQAGNVLRELNLAYRFAISNDRLPPNFQNPCPEIKTRIKDSGVKISNGKRQRVLTELELQKLWQWLPTTQFLSPTVKDVLKFTLLTGMRTGEVCVVQWSDVNLKEGTIFLKETKTGASRYVQLSVQAIKFLADIHVSGKYVFRAKNRSGNLTDRPLDQKQLTQQLYYSRKNNDHPDIDSWTPHDLRRTVRTQLAKLRCPREVSEAILGHSKKGIEGTYDLHHYEEEAKEWLQKWCDRLDEIVICQ
ncbi:tyrosine-type recombinase/integrase [Thiomicrorhabdus indica]|uniref:tyrosine-type recombinase/integrase n=1 Tax=Thiomicrorhabdus indica TaxID=2267253 RepID=UPI00197E0186|nr:site-specific integrase [Thiomicrorhabdus indica]